MLCIGENLEERKSGQWKNVLRKQLEKDLEGLSADRIPYIQIAYEPIWAIGTGVSASTEEITETHRYLKAVLSELTGSDIPLLMGITLISAVLVFAGNAAADGLYRLVDPRLRKGGRA